MGEYCLHGVRQGPQGDASGGRDPRVTRPAGAGGQRRARYLSSTAFAGRIGTKFPDTCYSSQRSHHLKPAGKVLRIRGDPQRRTCLGGVCAGHTVKALPPMQRLGAADALLISNPSIRGAQTARGLPGEPPPLPGTEMECRAVESILLRIGFTVARGTAESAKEVIGTSLRTDYRIVLIATHGLYEVSLHDGTTAAGVPLSDGAMLGAREFEQMRQPPELVFIDATRLARMDSIAPRDDAALQPQSPPQSQSLPAKLLQMGVRTVIAADSGLGDSAATDFCTAFFASVAEPERTVEQAMLAARQQAHARYPETGAWATYQLHGAAGYRIDAPEL